MWLAKAIASYDPIFKNIEINRIFVDPYYRLLKQSPNSARGMHVVLRHEVGHALIFKSHPIKARFFRNHGEAAAELYAIEDRGAADLIEGLAIMIISHKIAKNISYTKMLSEKELQKRTKRYIEYHSIDKWNDPKFIKGVSELYPKASEIARSIPNLDHDMMIKAVKPKLKETSNVLDIKDKYQND